MDDQKKHETQTKAQTLAAEICQVYKELKAIIPDAYERIGGKEPGWIPLESGSKATIRDYILRDYAQAQHNTSGSSIEIKKQAIACPLSFDITSNPYGFQIDHFHSRVDLMMKLNQLEDEPIRLDRDALSCHE